MAPAGKLASTVAAKGYGVPAFRTGFVRRPELIGRLLDSTEAALVLVSAPAGYGKSTLLAEWAAHDQRPFVWITIGPRHYRDRTGLAISITQAFEDTGWIDADLWPTVAGGEIAGLARLMRALDHAERTFVLVLDDAHAATKTALKNVVMAALEGLGQGSQIALATRSEPSLPIGRLRAHRSLVEIRTEDLMMTPAEAATLLRLTGLELEFGVVQSLARQTEGWPAGLYLAALSLRTRGDLSSGSAGFGGDDHRIAEYFRDEFLAGLSPEQTSFLIRTSVLDDLSGPLCDAVLGRSGSAATLSELAQRNLMLLPIDLGHERFRWHSMFRAMLQAELHRAAPEVETQLHTRASAWLGQHGDLDGAIDHAIVAGDVTRAGDLLWAHIVPYLNSGRSEAVRHWVGSLNRELVGGCPSLALAAAHSSLMMGDIDQARHWGLAAAEAGRQTGAPAETPSLESASAIIDAVAATDGVAAMAQAATRAHDLEPMHSPWRPMICLLRGVAEHLAGNDRSAAPHLDEGVRLSAGESPCIASLCLSQLTLIAIAQDDWESAAEHAERAAQIVEQPALASYPISALVFAASAATRAHQHRVDEAKRDLRHGVDLLAALRDFIPWYSAEARIMLAHSSLGLADTVRARTLLAEASRLARRTSGAIVLQRCLDQAWAQIDTMAETALSGTSSLTIAELRILRFLPSHRSFREIADRLGVSVNTVKTQAHAIYRKLDAASRSEAVARASRAGLL